MLNFNSLSLGGRKALKEKSGMMDMEPRCFWNMDRNFLTNQLKTEKKKSPIATKINKNKQIVAKGHFLRNLFFQRSRKD